MDKASSELMLQIMRGQVYRSRIPRYLTGYRVPHKTGDFLPFIGNDVGMLESAGPHHHRQRLHRGPLRRPRPPRRSHRRHREPGRGVLRLPS